MTLVSSSFVALGIGPLSSAIWLESYLIEFSTEVMGPEDILEFWVVHQRGCCWCVNCMGRPIWGNEGQLNSIPSIAFCIVCQHRRHAPRFQFLRLSIRHLFLVCSCYSPFVLHVIFCQIIIPKYC